MRLILILFAVVYLQDQWQDLRDWVEIRPVQRNHGTVRGLQWQSGVQGKFNFHWYILQARVWHTDGQTLTDYIIGYTFRAITTNMSAAWRSPRPGPRMLENGAAKWVRRNISSLAYTFHRKPHQLTKSPIMIYFFQARVLREGWKERGWVQGQGKI